MDRQTAKALSEFADAVAFKCPTEAVFVRSASERLADKLDSSAKPVAMNERLLTQLHAKAKDLSASDGQIFSRLYVRDTYGAEEAAKRRNLDRVALLQVLKQVAGHCNDGRVSHPFVMREIRAGL